MKIAYLFLALLPLAACSRLTPENYARLEVGMPYEDVRRILGEPTECSDVLTVRHCSWRDGERGVEVSFVGDGAIVFSSRKLR